MDKEYDYKYQLLREENRELKAYKDVNEDYKKAWEELNEKYSWLLKRYSNSISDKFAFGVERERLQEERDAAVVEYNNLLLKIVATIPFKGEIGTRNISVAGQLDRLIDSYNLLFKIDRMIDKCFSLQYPISCVEPLSNIKMKISKIINNH